MTHRLMRAASAMAAAAVLASCIDLEPDPPIEIPNIDVSLDFCSDDTPLWIAYQHLGENWVQLTPDANGTVEFSAEYRVALAFVHQNGGDTRTEMIFTTNNVLEGISGRACLEESGSKTLNGSVTGFTGSQLALVGMGFSSVYRTPAQTTFSLTNLPTRPLDIMASRMNIVGETEQRAEKTILRRSQNLVSGATVPVLDFDASEAISTTTANAAITGLSVTDDAAFLTVNFFSQLETSHLLTFLGSVGNGNHTVNALPSSALAAGDYHDLFVTAVTENQGVRGSERFFRSPGNHSLPVGPVLALPNIQQITTSPYVRVNVLLQAQLDYPSAISMQFDQQLQFSANQWTIWVTSSYFGATPAQWDIIMPDMTGAPGWQHSWGLQVGDYSWTVAAYGVRAELLFGAPPADGELTMYALRMSAPAAYKVAPPRRLRTLGQRR